ncbi:hypothetical protein ACUZXZ_01165 [Pseudomonas juntendi]
MSKALWNGQRLPPAGAACWVTPHNTIWGFDNLNTRLVKVVAYMDDYIWLMELHSDDTRPRSFITTRTDKVDFEPYRTPAQIAADEIEAIFNWLQNRDGERALHNIAEELHADGYRRQVTP